MSGIEFARPWMLLLLPLAPVALVAWALGVRRAAARARQLSRTRSAPPPYAAAGLFTLAAVTAVVAAAQPRWGTRESKVERTGADLVIVLDISRSMAARDVAPDRLAAAKTTIDATLDRLGRDRVGLVVFAGEARIRFPLTTDLTAAHQVVDTLETGVIFVPGGTNAGAGLKEAVALLNEEGGSGQVILLLTDGDDLEGDFVEGAQLVAQSGATLLVAGVGTPGGGTIPVADPRNGREQPKLDADGAPIVTKLDEPFLRALAAAAGGRYLGADLSVVPGAVDGRLRALQHSRIEERPLVLPVERYQYFAVAAIAVLVLASVAERVARFSFRTAGVVTALTIAAIVLGGCATSEYTANEAGRDALRKGDSATAIEKFLEVQVARPDDPNVALNLAAAYAAAGRNEEAILAARRALGSNEPSTRAKAYASIGHHQFTAGRLVESLDAFRRALLEDGTNDAARHDYEVVLRLLTPGTDPDAPTPPAGSPTPEGTPQPGSGPTQQPGSGSPQPGDGTPGSGTPQPGGTAPAGTPTTGTGTSGQSKAALDSQIRDIDQRVNRLLEEAGETPSPAEALEILRLLSERARLASLRDAFDGGGGVKDY